MLSTMSSSVAPSSIASCASSTLTSVRLEPCGKPTTVETCTCVPSSISRASLTSQGRTQMDATSYFFATSRPRRMVASSISGLSREWSSILAMSWGVIMYFVLLDRF